MHLFSYSNWLTEAVAGDLACNFIEKETVTQVFSCEFCEISRNTFSYKTTPVAASRLRVKMFREK